MDILNNLWSAITTPNEGLVNSILIPAGFVEAYLLMFLFINILNISTTRKRKWIYVIGVALVSLISMHIIPSPFNTFINYIFMFFLVFTIFKINVLKSIIAVVIPTLIFALVGSLILNPYLSICNITYEQFIIIPLYRIIYLFIMYLTYFIISILIGKLRNFKYNLFDYLDGLDKRQKSIISLNFIFGLFTICIQLYITFYYVNTYPISFTFLNFIALLSYFVISSYSLTRIVKLDEATKELESAEAFNRSLSVLHDSVRCFKHDFDNIVATIGGYIKTNDMNGLEKYYNQLVDDCQRVNNVATLNPEVINNTGVYNLLSAKYHKADEANVKINFEFFLDLNTLNMKIYEFTRILGILLDNAIEASSECEEKVINVKFRNEEKNHRQVIVIENTYNNKDVDVEEIFQKGITEKENHTGLGLWEIRQMLRKSNNANLYTTKTDKYFKQQLEIYYK